MPSIGPLEPILILLYDILGLAVFALAVYACGTTVIRILRSGTHRVLVPSDPALEALRMRLASGEIDESEWRRLRTVLETDTTGG